MASLGTIMAEIEAIRDLDVLHPKAFVELDVVIERRGARAVAEALGYLYAQARHDLALARAGRPSTRHGDDPAEGGA